MFSSSFSLKTTFVLLILHHTDGSLFCRFGFHLKRSNLNLMHVPIVVSLQVLRWWTGWCSCSWLWPVWRPWRWPRRSWTRASCAPLAWGVPRLCAPAAWASSSWMTPPLCTALWVLRYFFTDTLNGGEWVESAADADVWSQSDSLKKRGSVKAETSLSAVELSGKVIKRGYLLKQVNTHSLLEQSFIYILKVSSHFIRWCGPVLIHPNWVSSAKWLQMN